MVHFMEYKDNFIEFCKTGNRKNVIYGTSMFAESYARYIPEIAYVCNTYANKESIFMGMHVLSPKELENLDVELNIVIFSRVRKSTEEIKAVLSELTIEAYVFEFGNNIAFNCYRPKLNSTNPIDLRYVRLVCYGDSGWIIEKFALRMQEQLERKGIKAVIGRTVDEAADINHHIDFGGYEPIRDNRDTVMLTHVLHSDIAEKIIHQLTVARMGICMSRETMDKMVCLGVPREKLCYVNPAQDGNMKPKKYVLGITHRNYIDHRKRQSALLDICDKLDPLYFSIKIMGRGWETYVAKLKEMGFETEYYPEFDYVTYMNLMPTFDYFLFWGFDEGTMGYLDAIAAGVETLVTPQGFHLDVKDGITHPCRTISDFSDVLLQSQEKRRNRIKAVSDWTWERYVDKHIKIWNYVLGNRCDEKFYENQHVYEDGENSIFRCRNIIE